MTPSAAPPVVPPPRRPDASSLVAPRSTEGSARPLDLPDATAPRPAAAAANSDTAEQPAAQRPQQAQRAAPTIQRRPPTRRLEPGDLICAECGEGNPDSRKFCSRCGTSLSTAEIVKAKWWRRFIPGKGPKKRKAGDRPSARKTRRNPFARLLGVLLGGTSRVIGVILLIGGIVYAILPVVRDNVNQFVTSTTRSVKNLISPELKQVSPETTVANGAIKGHPASFATDRIKNDYWLVKGKPEPVLTVTFQSKIDLKQIIIHNGASGGTNYAAVSRPKQLIFVYDTGKTDDVSVDDKPDSQTHSVDNGKGVTSIKIMIPSTYVASKSSNIALTEIEFYREDS